ncbi:MAG: hypothetical protein BM485_04465 [Desulfobulbaceae bacterium DB1]|nr:MAG: hypothetical protein BM485_04465 [Desulfobulbaceae bacterium DB1]
MKTLTSILVFFWLLSLGLPAASHAADLGELRLSLIEGDVQQWNIETNEWIPVTINMPLYEGDRLWIPEGGKAEIQVRNGSFVRLNAYSSLEILRSDGNSLQAYLSEGQAYLNFSGRKDTMLQLDTPFSSTRAYEGTKFLADVNRTGETNIAVLSGKVFIDSSQGNAELISGQEFSLGDKYANIAPIGRQGAWEQWNRERDWKIADRRYNDEYLPEELSPYASDFDQYGRWVHVNEYGHVWTPTLAVSSGWSPYSQGRWIWRGGDYVWISYEPWGWAPYHYGRWSFVSSIGWCWIPPPRGAVYWGPGYVGWVSTPNYVAWVPLAPGDTYYGYGDYGPSSINIININVHKHYPRRSYRNLRARNAVTVIHHDTFLHGRRHDLKVKENPFLKDVPHVGRPTIRPAKETYAPVQRNIDESKRPPEYIRKTKVTTIQQERPLVKDRNLRVLQTESFERSGREWKRERGLPFDEAKQGQEIKKRGDSGKQQETIKNREMTAPSPLQQQERTREEQRTGGEPIRREPDYSKQQQLKQGDSPTRDNALRDQPGNGKKKGPGPELKKQDTPVVAPQTSGKARTPERAEKAPAPAVGKPITESKPAPLPPRVRQEENQGGKQDPAPHGQGSPDWNTHPQRGRQPIPPEVRQNSGRERPSDNAITAPAPRPGQAPQPGQGDAKRGKQPFGKNKKIPQTEEGTEAQENLLLYPAGPPIQ